MDSKIRLCALSGCAKVASEVKKRKMGGVIKTSDDRSTLEKCEEGENEIYGDRRY